MTMRITIKDPKRSKFYIASVTPQWARRHDNGALVSCGLTVGEKSSSTGKSYLSESDLEHLQEEGRLKEIDHDEWNHSGCQSGCTRRGDRECRW